MTWRPYALALLVLVLGAARSAEAAPSEAEKQARRSFERAEANFKAGLFAEALAQYRAGYEQLPLPGFLINMAQCQRRMGDLVQARTTYRKFLMVAPDSPYVEEVKALIAELDKLVEASESGAAAGTGTGAAAGASALNPPPLGERALPAAAPPVATPADSLVEAPTAPPAATTGTRWWLWGTAGAVLVAGAVVAVYALKSPETATLHEGSLGTLRR